MRTLPVLTLAIAAMPLGIATAQLRGSEQSMERQHRVAIRSDLSFMGTGNEVRQMVHDDRLVPVRTSRTLLVKNVSYAYARPQVASFLQRLAAEYYAAAHEQLVVTSLVRPITEQPANASPLSVHPAGMAVDLRIPDTWEHRRWLEDHLLALERRSVLDVTLEYHPAHYHVAVFPTEYMRYASSLSAVRPSRFSAGAPQRFSAGARALQKTRAVSSRRGVAAVSQRGTARREQLSGTRAGREPKHPHSARKATTGSNRAARAAG